jgi:hypothetical protein
LVGVWGCAPDPDLVYVDLDAVELRSTTSTGSAAGFDVEAYSLDQSVAPLDGTDVYFGSAEERAIQALDVYRKTQRDAAQALLKRLRSAYLNEVALTAKAETDAADEEYAKLLSAEVEALHTVFLEHARKVEPLRFELTQIVGFPDPDPRSLKVPLESNEKAYKRFLKARTLREEIIAFDDAFRAETDRRMAFIETARKARLAAIGQRAEARQDEALRRAQQEADKITLDALAALEPTALDPGAQLPAVPGAASSVNSGPVSVAPQPGSAELRETKEDLEAQLKVFLKTYRYHRTRDASLGRDATQEFLVWRRKYTDGR